MKKSLWEFTDNKGTFQSKNAHRIKTLYLPLCNNIIMSSVTPLLAGDIKRDQNTFLLEPVSRINLLHTKATRNFWIYINQHTIWSATGVSKDTETGKHDTASLEAGLLRHTMKRQNKSIGLCSEITSCVPSSDEPIEIMMVTISNIIKKPVFFIPTAAIPLYARSAENIRDHRHVTSLLNRVEKNEYGIIVTPTLLFDETGHKKNTTSYFVYGIDDSLHGPAYLYPTQEEFIGNSDLEMPDAVYKNCTPQKSYSTQGKEAMGGLRFKRRRLNPGESVTYIILMGIVKAKSNIVPIVNTFNSPDKCSKALSENAAYWHTKSSTVSTTTGDTTYDNWLQWVSVQPTLRKIYGNSFLPDFDYGKGGRGWRDLWQDVLALIITDPSEAKELLINNFSGVKIDGSNATVIGKRKGEFIADRNNISRVWMDHGAWPLVTTLFYIHQSGDMDILSEKEPYFKDHRLSRSRTIDTNWKPDDGIQLKTTHQAVYNGSVLEHLLLQNIVPFFNVGSHNHIRLENADWNDGLDMAYEYGESVAFTALYAQNVKSLCEIISKLKVKKIEVLKELSILLDTIHGQPIDYDDINAKKDLLEKYFSAINKGVSGEKTSIQVRDLIEDLTKKAEWISGHIRKNEWLKEGFFNGYYNNDKKRVEGLVNGSVRMTLTGQVFPIMSTIASEEHITTIFKNAKKYLQDKKLGGFRLNTDFKEEQHNLGRAFSFAYGDKENGAFFNHMSVLFACALYTRGFAKEGYEVLNSIYKMAVNSNVSRIYPCIPEYFNNKGQGMYAYLTGSASWYILTLLTQVFGIRGEYGDLVIEPKLVKEQFKKNKISIKTSFAGRKLEVIYNNPHKKDFGNYAIKKVVINGKESAKKANKSRFSLSRKDFLSRTHTDHNSIEILLD